MQHAKQAILDVARAYYAVDASFAADLAALPEWTQPSAAGPVLLDLSISEARVLLNGVPEAIAKLVVARPELQQVEDFLAGYAF